MSMFVESRIQVPDSIRATETVGAGLSSWVHRLDAVAKCFHATGINEKMAEIAIYERLGSQPTWHEGIMRYYGVLNECVILQFAPHGSIRQYLRRDSRRHHVSLSTKLCWAEQAASAIAFLHSKDILHCDISCNNIFLDGELNVLVGDFSGSSLDGKECLTWYEVGYCHPDAEVPTTKSEIFALGSTFYEILSGQKPFEGADDNSIEDAFRRGHFPSLESLPALQNPIAKCWKQEYESVDTLLHDIKREGLNHNSTPIYLASY